MLSQHFMQLIKMGHKVFFQAASELLIAVFTAAYKERGVHFSFVPTHIGGCWSLVAISHDGQMQPLGLGTVGLSMLLAGGGGWGETEPYNPHPLVKKNGLSPPSYRLLSRRFAAQRRGTLGTVVSRAITDHVRRGELR